MTEAAHQIASNPLPPHPRKPGSVDCGWAGIAVDGRREVAPGVDGEVVIRGAQRDARLRERRGANDAALRATGGSAPATRVAATTTAT